ncbi:copper resistance protein B [Hirschia baltica]|uniref:Copper resistance B n=1 Tax=Hirschia baltica (strain ATCC 49814 / DSM 5838 / IFAM 1418) TaxID=582402 RepID=C6XPB0_HIRBI|nr:copper resistance protein B [Hirschia baltica]ACT58396.1 copper resistance B precursor [Hirschia baltica ATCC 49814]
MKSKILIVGALAMATALPALAAEGDPVYNYTLAEADIAEIDDETVGAFDAQGWVGGDYNRFWWKTGGEFADGDFDDAEVQALYSRYISKFWDAQIGVRYDLESKGETYGVIGLQGLAPYFFEVDAAAFVSSSGDVSARFEATGELLFTQRLILEPGIALDFYAEDDPSRQIGSGLSTAEYGAQLRYELTREFAPYVALTYEEAYGDTAYFQRLETGSANRTIFKVGIRTMF